MAGFGAERAALHQCAFAVGDGVLDQHGVGQVPVDAGEIFKAEFVGAVGAVPRTRFLHLSLRLLARSLGSIFWLDLFDTSANAPSLGRQFTIPNVYPPAGKRATLYRASQLLPRPRRPQG